MLIYLIFYSPPPPPNLGHVNKGNMCVLRLIFVRRLAAIILELNEVVRLDIVRGARGPVDRMASLGSSTPWVVQGGPPWRYRGWRKGGPLGREVAYAALLLTLLVSCVIFNGAVAAVTKRRDGARGCQLGTLSPYAGNFAKISTKIYVHCSLNI
jgi:hypothetical protein